MAVQTHSAHTGLFHIETTPSFNQSHESPHQTLTAASLSPNARAQQQPPPPICPIAGAIASCVCVCVFVTPRSTLNNAENQY
jgi:hypothetical protein